MSPAKCKPGVAEMPKLPRTLPPFFHLTPLEILEMAYFIRPCFICSKSGSCSHREPVIELAIVRRIS